MSKKKQSKLPILGRTAKVDIPDWNIYEIEAKIDSGAYTSSLHCHHIASTKDNKVRFNLLDPSHPDYNERLIELPIFKIKSVKSSNGTSQERIIIKTILVIAGQRFEAQLSLTDRSEMRYPLLIGRRLLKGRFLIDVSKKLYKE